MNAFSYMQMLVDGAIVHRCIEKSGPEEFYSQQNNALAHGPGGEVIAKQFCMLNWPPHSPDGSPIEVLWSIIRRKLKGRTFQSDDELFTTIKIAWNAIPEAEIDKHVGSFRAWCQVCLEIEGECLTQH
jgi:transposase